VREVWYNFQYISSEARAYEMDSPVVRRRNEIQMEVNEDRGDSITSPILYNKNVIV